MRGARTTSESPRSRSADSRSPARSRRVVVALGLAIAGGLLAAGDAHGSDDVEREAARARATAARIELEWPIAPAGPVTRFVRSLGSRLGRAADPSPFPWRFTVVRDRSANALSIGGGRIYVNEGTVFVCRNEAELAAILAHEMAHELAGHFRKPPRSGGRSTIGSIRAVIDPEKEMEADRISVSILARAGYDPRAALSAAELLEGSRGGDDGNERIAELSEIVAALPSDGRIDSAEFRRLRQDAGAGSE